MRTEQSITKDKHGNQLNNVSNAVWRTTQKLGGYIFFFNFSGTFAEYRVQRIPTSIYFPATF